MKNYVIKFKCLLFIVILSLFAVNAYAQGDQFENIYEGNYDYKHLLLKQDSGIWQPYQDRYAIIVMGGNVSGQHYLWYWNDTKSMYLELLSYGFTGQNIIFLSYGDSAQAHPDWVDTTSTTSNIISAYQWVENQCDENDLFYIYWVDHGSQSYFVTHDGTITHSQLGDIMEPIVAKQIIGAYNPCYSGAVIDDISRIGVITITSQDATHPNSWGWAGQWRRALRGAPEDSVDTNFDGQISITEAYNWIYPKSQAAGEHSMYDDNGDGVGHEGGQAGYNPNDPLMDGYIGNFYSLNNYYDTTSVGIKEKTAEVFENLILYPNPAQNVVNLSFLSENSGKLNITLNCINGKTIYKETVNNFKGSYNNSIDISGLAKGIYFISIIFEKGTFVKKLIIE